MSKISLFLWYVYNLMEKKANEQVVIAHCDSAREGTIIVLFRISGDLVLPEEIILLIFKRIYIIIYIRK